MKKSHLLGAMCASIFSFISVPSHAALVDNGGGLIYDDALDITWSQPDALRTWNNANTWAAGLTLGGVSGWRLPYISVAAGAGPTTSSPINCSTATEPDCRDNELGYMFYQNLSGTLGFSILTSGDPDLALFPSLVSHGYWSGTEFDFFGAWLFDFSGGGQGDVSKDPRVGSNYSWAVHVGNVGAVPVPAAVWLFGSGLLGLIGMSRRKKA
jgi:hypothetical protein